MSIVESNSTTILDSYFGFNVGYDGVAIYYDAYLNNNTFILQNSEFENNTSNKMNMKNWKDMVELY